ncbi:MAG: hypothetical protein AAFV69_14480 [Pseudomonadota bacterium]
MTFDPRDFLSHLDDFDVPEAQKIAVIESMWVSAQGFVDHAHGLSSGQQLWTEDACGNGNKSSNVIQFKGAVGRPLVPANDNQIPSTKKGTARL